MRFMRHTISTWTKHRDSQEAKENSRGDGRPRTELSCVSSETPQAWKKTILGRLTQALTMLIISGALHFFLAIVSLLVLIKCF